jgi:hypothetical protein
MSRRASMTAMRLALLVLVIAACQKPTETTVDPAIGRWRGDTGHVIELRADGTLDMEPLIAAECDRTEHVIGPCKARQTWSRSGSIVALSRGSLSGTPCTCRLERIDVTLRGDELVYGREHAQRVK